MMLHLTVRPMAEDPGDDRRPLAPLPPKTEPPTAARAGYAARGSDTRRRKIPNLRQHHTSCSRISISLSFRGRAWPTAPEEASRPRHAAVPADPYRS
ncbi:hypothetical protein GWI33_017570 [Rhynchophorus ferrugineus]|uniref:Uncharacterized protein n=1 Tax=Rhynchophorus ferrugineus TaxID=354439 RepID=A0A834M629_RHYFE|nr:hypothetical protein GWI33_017570 [Rhynchophorus ferrugineus]